MRRAHSPRLVSRFALGSFVAFVAVGATLSVVISRQLREWQEGFAQFHAAFVVDSIMRYEVTEADLQAPMDASDPRYHELLSVISSRILRPPVVRVKVYMEDGTIVFSDEPRLLGSRLEAGEELAEVFEGTTISEISDLASEENVYERGLATKLFETYVPLYVYPGTRGSPDAVVEIYQDYAGIQNEIDRLFLTIAVTLLIALGALYVLLLPISRRVARRLSEQNRQLEEQAERLGEAVQKEQGTVAELRELNRLKDEFVAVASHEVRTPLTSIIGYAKTLRRPEFADDAPAREEFLEAIERQGARLSQLVDNLLASSQIDSDHRTRVVEPVPFDEVVKDVVGGLGPRGTRVRLALPPQRLEVAGDSQRLELIVSNLLDNALKFSPEHLECELGARRQGQSIVFWVRDRGIGIPREQVDRIFERFYQVDSSITRRFGGVGLGLSLVKELVEDLGGSIQVTSELGRGTTFMVTLPMSQSPGDGDGRPPGRVEQGSAAVG